MYFRRSATQLAAHHTALDRIPTCHMQRKFSPNHKPATAFLLVLFPKFVQFFFQNRTDSCGPEFMGSDPTVKKLPHCDSSFAFVYKLYDSQLMFIISHYIDRISYYGMIEFAPSTMTLWPEK